MRFNLIIFLFFITSCTSQLSTINKKELYSSTGFALIYNNFDFEEKIIKGKMNNDLMQISHQNLRTGTLIKITNPKNKESITLKNIKRIKYPDFYKVLITRTVAEKLKLNKDLPILEITEIKRNKSFIAKKAKIYNEEKKIPSKAPVASVQISNISKNKFDKKTNNLEQLYIQIASFYSLNTANFLKQRIIKDIAEFDGVKVKVKKINNKENLVISGPYKSINLLKNDYILLKNYGFEELDIYLNE